MRSNNIQICLEEIISYMPGNIYWTDKDGFYLGCNENVAKTLKLVSSKDICGKVIHELIADKKIADEIATIDAEVIAQNKEIVTEQEGFDANGRKAIYLTRKIPLHDSQGNVIGVLGVSLDITERKLAEQATKAKEAAEATNRTKTEFLANMSHDVKTPLTGVVGMADILRHDLGARDVDRERADAIYTCGLQVVSFFNSCLELSKMETQAWITKIEQFSLKKLLEDIYHLFLPMAETKKLRLLVEYDDNLPPLVESHRESIYRILLNLVGNAIKFTEKGQVTVRVFLISSDNDQAHVGFSAQDSGMGIPEDKHQVIFEKLYRLTPSYEGKVEGSGMGLYIVDQYVKRMGGSIEVKSHLGEGSIFTASLPLKIISDKHSAINHPIEHITSDHKNKPSEHSPRILLVEDVPLVQHITQSLLNDGGFNVEIASTDNEAVTMFTPDKYDLIYMDIGLPDIDGYEATKRIREKEKNNSSFVPIIALTGHGAVDVKTFCGEAGMQGVLSKPLSREQAKKVWLRYGEHQLIDVPELIAL